MMRLMIAACLGVFLSEGARSNPAEINDPSGIYSISDQEYVNRLRGMAIPPLSIFSQFGDFDSFLRICALGGWDSHVIVVAFKGLAPKQIFHWEKKWQDDKVRVVMSQKFLPPKDSDQFRKEFDVDAILGYYKANRKIILPSGGEDSIATLVERIDENGKYSGVFYGAIYERQLSDHNSKIIKIIEGAMK
ncbi:hypothetical protein OVA24_19125 [Luteolibacter sp. SL250]|uniref:hypothetical protein n=1 Tax=Luteolibacter sp. SL250 TaxID=2995170 RepID=UPI00227056D2|nr:hypothetical protein [Luteolibacter sp. SL250]WAC19343.1 hypothetical protein OVA24_19125 [Luteolibacter sp. SL250]